MNYTKPELCVLGDAGTVIQLTGADYKTRGVQDGQNIPGHMFSSPAYDLDE